SCFSSATRMTSRSTNAGSCSLLRCWRICWLRRCAMRKGWTYAAALLAAGAAGWAVQGWRMGEQMAEQRTEHVDQLRRTAEANARVILHQQAEQQAQAQRLAELDTKHTKELSDALDESRRLEDLYSRADDERRRLRIDVIVARNDAIVSAA